MVRPNNASFWSAARRSQNLSPQSQRGTPGYTYPGVAATPPRAPRLFPNPGLQAQDPYGMGGSPLSPGPTDPSSFWKGIAGAPNYQSTFDPGSQMMLPGAPFATGGSGYDPRMLQMAMMGDFSTIQQNQLKQQQMQQQMQMKQQEFNQKMQLRQQEAAAKMKMMQGAGAQMPAQPQALGSWNNTQKASQTMNGQGAVQMNNPFNQAYGQQVQQAAKQATPRSWGNFSQGFSGLG